MLGYAFNAAGIISTYHPVSAGLTVIGTLLTAKSDSAASIFDENVKRTTNRYNEYANAVAEAKKRYDEALKNAADAGTGTNKNLELRQNALEDLDFACSDLGNLVENDKPASQPPQSPK